MTWQQAVVFNDIVSIALLILWATVPVVATLSIVWRRRLRPGVGSPFAVTVLLIWLAITGLWLLIVFSRAFYSEGGSEQGEAVFLGAMTLSLVILHLVFLVIGIRDFRRASNHL